MTFYIENDDNLLVFGCSKHILGPMLRKNCYSNIKLDKNPLVPYIYLFDIFRYKISSNMSRLTLEKKSQTMYEYH